MRISKAGLAHIAAAVLGVAVGLAVIVYVETLTPSRTRPTHWGTPDDPLVKAMDDIKQARQKMSRPTTEDR